MEFEGRVSFYLNTSRFFSSTLNDTSVRNFTLNNFALCILNQNTVCPFSESILYFKGQIKTAILTGFKKSGNDFQGSYCSCAFT